MDKQTNQQTNVEPTNRDILEAVKELSARVGPSQEDGRSLSENLTSVHVLLETTAGTLKDFMDKTDVQFEAVKQEIGAVKFSLESEIGEIKVTMATKADLKSAVEDFKAGTRLMVQHEDRKVDKIVDTLHQKRVFVDEDVRGIHQLDIFPKTV